MNATDTNDNDSTASTLQSCAAGQLAANPQLQQQFNMGWQTALTNAAIGAGIAIAADASVEAIITVMLALNTVATDVIAEVVSDLFTYLLELLASLIPEVFTTILGSTAVGAGTAGYVGAVIGFIIGVIIALVQYFDPNPYSIVITNGTTIDAKPYIQTNLANAAAWLMSQKTLVGVTPLWFSNQQNLFLANPTWLWANQDSTGMCQPTPPDQGSGDPVDLIFTQAPGAFELLSKAQFVEACILVGVSPGKWTFFSSILRPTGASVPITITPMANTATPSAPVTIQVDPAMVAFANPNSYNPVWSQGVLGWMPDNQTISGSSIAWPAAIPNYAIDSSACVSGGQTSSDASPPLVKSGNTQGNNYSAYTYTSCPNLATNGNAANTTNSALPGGQTDIAPGIFALQLMYPALTTSQCISIFAANYPAYQKWVQQATGWAMEQCALSFADLGTGSQWNLEPDDVNAILQQWAEPNPLTGQQGHPGCTTTITLTPGIQNVSAVPGGPINVVPPTGGNWLSVNGGPLSGQDAYVLPTPPNGTYTFIYMMEPGVMPPVQTTTLTIGTPSAASGAGTAGTVASTLAKGSAAIVGLGAIGVGAYAASNGIGVVAAAKEIFNMAAMAVRRRL
jgi:hypothetical protein